MASSPHIPTTDLSPSLNTEWRSPLTVDMISFAKKKAPSTRKENAHGQAYWIGCPRVKLQRCGPRSQWQETAVSVLETNAKAMIGFLQAGLLYLQYDALRELCKQAEKRMLVEARKHSVYQVIKTCSGLGKIRTAQLMSVVVTPYRFANKRRLWAYCGLDIVMRSSSDWVRTQGGEWIKAPIQRTRGLNRNFNRSLKHVFKGAATTVIGCAKKDDPLYLLYSQMPSVAWDSGLFRS